MHASTTFFAPSFTVQLNVDPAAAVERAEIIPSAQVGSLLAAAFKGTPLVSEAYSRFDFPLRSFGDPTSLERVIHAEREAGNKSVSLVVHYPESKGQVITRRINLLPEKCNGASWRETLEGWGLIQLQLEYQGGDTVKCRIAVNSERRAEAWAQTYPEFGSPELWDWQAVERHARRLIRVLRSGV